MWPCREPVPSSEAFNSSPQAFRCHAEPLSLLESSWQGKVPRLPPLLRDWAPACPGRGRIFHLLVNSYHFRRPVGRSLTARPPAAGSAGRCLTSSASLSTAPWGLPALPRTLHTPLAAWGLAQQRNQRNAELKARALFKAVSPSKAGWGPELQRSLHGITF